MTSLVKKGFQLGKAVYDTAVVAIDEQKQKQQRPQHPPGGYYPQGQAQAPAGQYQQVHIPGQHTSSGQQHAPTLPPRPQTHTPQPQGYIAPQAGYAQHHGYEQHSSTGVPNPTHNQTAHGSYMGASQAQSAHVAPYEQHSAVSHGVGQAPSHAAHQTTGTIPASHQQQTWNYGSPTPTPPAEKPLSAWEIAGGARPAQPASVPPPQSWTPASPPPTTVSPLHAHSPYTPPTPSHVPMQPFPQQHAPAQTYQQQHVPAVQSSHVPPQQQSYHSPPPSHPMSPPPSHVPTPPMSPPLPSPPLSQGYGQYPQYPPVSPAVQQSAGQHPYSYGNQGLTSPTPPAGGFQQYQTPVSHQPSPLTQVMSPVSPTGAFPASPLPHPPAFVSELPAFSEPKPAPAEKPTASQFIAAPVPDGYAELPADLTSEPASKPATSQAENTPPTIPAAAVTPSSSVEQPKPMHPPQQHPSPQQSSSQPIAYAPQQYAPAQPAQTPPATTAYQPYQPQQSPSALQQAPAQIHTSPPAQDVTNGHSGYQPYAPPAQGPIQYTAMPAQGPPAQQGGVPRRMGSLASKFSSMSVNSSTPQPSGQYAQYPGAQH